MLPRLQTALDRYQSDIGRYISSQHWNADIEVISKWHFLTGRCRCKNETSIRHRIVDVVSATEFRRPDNRTISHRYQSDAGLYMGPTSKCRHRSFIKMAYLHRLCQCRNQISIRCRIVDVVSATVSHVFISLPYRLLHRPEICSRILSY